VSTLRRILKRARSSGGGEDDLLRLKQVLAQDPTSRQFALLADIYRRKGLHDEAIAVCRRGLSSHPTYVSGHVALARAYEAAGDVARAIASYERVVALAPDNLAGHLGLGTLYERADRFKEARDHVRAAMQLGADGPEVRAALERLEARERAEEGAALGAGEGDGEQTEGGRSARVVLLRRKIQALEAFCERVKRDYEGRNIV